MKLLAVAVVVALAAPAVQCCNLSQLDFPEMPCTMEMSKLFIYILRSEIDRASLTWSAFGLEVWNW